MSDSVVQSWFSRRTANIVVVAAAWLTLLLMCRFAFSGLVRLHSVGTGSETGYLILLALGAVAGSFLAAALFDAKKSPRGLTTYFRLCSLAALASALLPLQDFGYWVAGLMGLAMGGLAVTLFTGLRSSVGRAKLGWYIGIGVGLAHALCITPWLSQSPPVFQAVFACVAALLGSLLAGKLQIKHTGASTSSDYEPRIVKAWVLALGILSLMEATCFIATQSLRLPSENGWMHGVFLCAPVLTHCLVAGLTGRMLDKGSRVWLILISFCLLAFAGTGLRFVGILGIVPVLAYSAGASIYWVCILYYVARGGKPWQVAVVLSLAGWLGWALGTYTANGETGLSHSLIVLYGLAMIAVLGWRWLKVGRFRRASLIAVLLTLGSGKLLIPGAHNRIFSKVQFRNYGTFGTSAYSYQTPLKIRLS